MSSYLPSDDAAATMSINGRRARTLRKKRDEDEMRGADGLSERPRETWRDTCIVY